MAWLRHLRHLRRPVIHLRGEMGPGDQGPRTRRHGIRARRAISQPGVSRRAPAADSAANSPYPGAATDLGGEHDRQSHRRGPGPDTARPHHHPSGRDFDKYGCVLYTVAALSALMRPDDRICPVVHVRRQDEDAIKEQLSAFPNVDITGVRADNDRGDVVELTYVAHNMRVERQTGFMSPIRPAGSSNSSWTPTRSSACRSPTMKSGNPPWRTSSSTPVPRSCSTPMARRTP